MSEFKKLVEQLSPSGISADFIESQSSRIEGHARAIGLTARFVTSRSLLHLPFHSAEEVTTEPGNVMDCIEPKVAFLGGGFKSTYDSLKDQSDMRLVTSDAKLKGRKELYIQDGVVKIPAIFKDVPTALARIIQDKLHYIGSSRTDSILDCGLYLDQAEVPYAATSFSNCERGYQLNALNRATGLELEPSEVLSMTRAFAFDGAPANSMSKLFHLAHVEAKRRFPDTKAIITALNPFLRFGGGIFTGSSYTPYALAPMEYWYDADGFYVPRSKGVQPQKMETSPIIWLAHGLDSRSVNAIDKIDAASRVHVSKDEYRNG